MLISTYEHHFNELRNQATGNNGDSESQLDGLKQAILAAD